MIKGRVGKKEPLQVANASGTLESLSKKFSTSLAYPKEVPQGEGEANSQGHRAHTAIPPLVICSKDAEHELERQEDLHGGGLAHTYPSVQLTKGRKEATVSTALLWVPHSPLLWLSSRDRKAMCFYLRFS